MPVLTDKQLRDAIEKADVPPRDYRIFGALVYRADWSTGVIPQQFQPRSLEALAKVTRMSRASVATGLAHLESHGWLVRERQQPGRGYATRYALRIGLDCGCIPAPAIAPPKPEAERSRRYRARQKASRICVTEPGEASSIPVTKRQASRDDVAGQAPVSAEKAVMRGIGEGKPWRDAEGNYLGGPVDWGWPADSYGEEANPR